MTILLQLSKVEPKLAFYSILQNYIMAHDHNANKIFHDD